MQSIMQNIIKFVLFSFLLSANTLPAQARQPAAPPSEAAKSIYELYAVDKRHVLQDRFVIVRTMRAIPQAVRHSLVGSDPYYRMADPGQPMERVGDTSGHLPSTRLVFAGLSPGYCLVYNEDHGTDKAGTEVFLYHLSPRQALLVWQGELTDSTGNLSLPQLRSEIRKGRYFRDPPLEKSGQ